MASKQPQRIESALFCSQALEKLDVLRTSCIKQGRSFKRRIATHRKKTIEIEKKGRKQKVRYTEEELTIEIVEQEVFALIDNDLNQLQHDLEHDVIDLCTYNTKYRSKSDTSKWASVLVEPQNNIPVNKLASLLIEIGLELAPNEYDSKEEAVCKLEMFGLVHVKVPPEKLAIEKTGELDGVKALFDPERLVSIPNPVISASNIKMALDASIPIVWPVSDIVPPDMPPPGHRTKVCIVDTGIDSTHPDLKGKVVAWQDFTSEKDGIDYCGHGTHCAGIAAGDGAASHGRYTGLAPYAQLLSAKVLNRYGSGRISDILLGLRWAYEQGADIVSLSLGGDGQTDGKSILSRACSVLVDKGIIVCVSAGNGGPGDSTITMPGDSQKVITVGAIDKDYRMAGFSSRGPTSDPAHTGNKPNVVAPGVNVVSCRSTTASDLPVIPDMPEYISFSGTSMACPHVSGVAAVLLSYARHIGLNLSAAETCAVVQKTAISIGPEPPGTQGTGLIQVPSALMMIYQRQLPAIAAIDPSQEKPFRNNSRNISLAIPPSEELVQVASQPTRCDHKSKLGNCSHCGKTITTKLDVAGECVESECKSIICNACWTINGSRYCRTHVLKS